MTAYQSKESNWDFAKAAAYQSLAAYTILTHGQYEMSDHQRLLCSKLEAIERGDLKRLLVTMPPRHGKSELCSRRFPAWFLGRNPHKEVIFCTYSQEFANDFGTQVKNQIQGAEFSEIFDVRLDRSSKSKKKFLTEEGGGYSAVGADGALTGRGMHLGIIDDPFKNRSDAQSETMRKKIINGFKANFLTRLAPSGAIVVIQTRWHEEDLAGWIVENMPDEWEIINMPAISDDNLPLWPDRWPIDELVRIRESIGTFEFEALYQQNPTPAEGGLIKHEWFRYYKELPNPVFKTWSWDTAIKDGDGNDFSVGGLWVECENGFYLHDVFREKIQYPSLKASVSQCFDSMPSNEIVIEDKASGQQLVQDFRRSNLPVVAVCPGREMPRDKISRVNLMAPYFEAGKVFLPEEKTWVKEYIQEVCGFPNVKHDDMVDMTSQYFARVHNRKAPRIRAL